MEWRCLLASPFFGLTPEYRASVFDQIHQIVFHGKGGYDHTTVYEMPVWLRNYTFRKISDFYEKEKEEYEKAKGRQKATVPKGPGVRRTPTYNTKARK